MDSFLILLILIELSDIYLQPWYSFIGYKYLTCDLVYDKKELTLLSRDVLVC